MTDQSPLTISHGPRATPDELLQGHDLRGQTAIVTGGYSGIGLEAVKALSKAGAAIIVPARRPDFAKDRLAGIDNITVAGMDLADLSSAQKFARDVAANGTTIDLLINNAGVMASPLSRVGPGWESQFAINHLGHFVLTTELLPSLKRADSPRVIALSSLAHRISSILWDDPQFENTDYEKWVAYGQSKTANALFARALNNRESDVLAFSVHPGGIMTDLQRHLTTEEMVARGWMNEDGTMPEAVKAFFKSPEEGAGTTIFAAISKDLANHGGVYCEDCNIAAPATPETPRGSGVAPHVRDEALAEGLWAKSEELTGVSFQP